MTLRIEVSPSTTGKCWLATFSGTDTTGIPTGVPIPLPFAPEATYDLVYDHLHSRFPLAVIAWPAAPKGWSTAGGPTDQEPVKTEQERVSCAIVQAWDAISDVPFPLYHREAMALAAAALDAMKVKA